VGLLSFVFGNVMGGSGVTFLHSAWLGIGGFLLMPLLFGIIGFCAGLLTAWFYNLLSWWVGGIRVQLSKEDLD
jgi:hypothetical protein